MMRRTILTATLLAPLSALAAEPPAPSLSLGTVELTLGMTEEKALTALREHYVLKPVPHTRSYFVQEKDAKDGAAGASLGALEVADGKVSAITREHRPQGNADAVGWARALTETLAGLVREGRTSCTLESETSTPQLQVATVRCDRKTVSLVLVAQGAETKIAVTEMVR
jgi:hypothetical protein